jgi:hypothetical protein
MTGHRIYRVIGFEYLEGFVMRVTFNDGSEQTIDFGPVLYGPIFGALRDPVLFRQAELVDYAGCLEWPNGADFDPETLYNWPEYKDENIERRKHFAKV